MKKQIVAEPKPLTYSQLENKISMLEDKVFVLEDDLEQANEAITIMREINRGE